MKPATRPGASPQRRFVRPRRCGQRRRAPRPIMQEIGNPQLRHDPHGLGAEAATIIPPSAASGRGGTGAPIAVIPGLLAPCAASRRPHGDRAGLLGVACPRTLDADRRRCQELMDTHVDDQRSGAQTSPTATRGRVGGSYTPELAARAACSLSTPRSVPQWAQRVHAVKTGGLACESKLLDAPMAAPGVALQLHARAAPSATPALSGAW